MDISDMKHRQASAQWPGYVVVKRTDEQIRRLFQHHVSFLFFTSQEAGEIVLRRRGTL